MAMRPSSTTKAAEQSPRFPWDYEYDVPNNEFWSSFDRGTTQAIFACFDESPGQHDLRAHGNMSLDEKCKLLRTMLTNKLEVEEKRAAPAPIQDVDHATWKKLKLGLAAIDTAAGDVDAEERTARELYEHGPRGTKDMNALYSLAHIYEAHGKWAEAEVYSRQTLAWIQGLEKLGPDSPQALGEMRRLVKVLGKQGKKLEAEDWVEKCLASIERMGKGQFAKYQEEEVEELERVVKALESGQ